MSLITWFVDLLRNPHEVLQAFLAAYGAWAYALLFAVIFAETGLVVTPFLPGESLLFAAGAVAGSTSVLNPWLLYGILLAAAILGDTVNYWIGKTLGPRMLRNENSRILKKEYLDKTHRFFHKYGGKTIILGRFVPFVRTFAPFLAGVGEMSYPRFFAYNVAGAFAWVTLAFGAGYLFGQVPFVEDNFTLVVVGIVAVSLLPGVYEYVMHHREKRSAAATSDEGSVG